MLSSGRVELAKEQPKSKSIYVEGNLTAFNYSRSRTGRTSLLVISVRILSFKNQLENASKKSLNILGCLLW